MDCDFQVGDDVVCIDNLLPHGRHPATDTPPVIGRVYKIRSLFVPRSRWAEHHGVACRLEGLQRSIANTGREKGWPTDWFRRFIRTDISDLREIVRNVFNEQKVDAD